MSDLPSELQYTATHEWIRVEEDHSVTIGITDHAQDLLGDIVFIELPEEGSTVAAKDELSVIESVKAASDIFSPIGGEVTEINEKLLDAPDLINGSPYEDGWFFKMQPDDLESLNTLLSSEEYTNSQES